MPLVARRHRARVHGRRGLLRLFPAACSNTDRGKLRIPRTGPTVVRAGSRTTRWACGRASASCAAARRAPAVTATPTCPTSTGTRSWRRRNNALCTGCHQNLAATADGAHAASRRQRRQLVRRVPHAEDGDEHQGDDARSHDEPAGSGEHRRVRHPQRLHRVPRRQEGSVGGRDGREMVAAGAPLEASSRAPKRSRPPAPAGPRRWIG